jgi:hypothetical protein
MNKLLSRIAAAAGAVGPECLALCGAGSIAFGAGLMYLPAGFITGGVLAMAIAYFQRAGESE